MLRYALLLLISSVAVAETQPCALQDKQRVFVVGEIHGTEMANDVQSVMIESALRGKILLGLEIDADTLYTSLKEQFRDQVIPLEESFSKGFALSYWAWWTTSWHFLNYNLNVRKQIYNPDAQEAVDSLLFFLRTNTNLQAALANARTASLDGLAKSDTNLQTVLDGFATSSAVMVDRYETVGAASVILKEILRAYSTLAIEDYHSTKKYYVPEKILEMPDFLNFREIKRGTKDYAILYKWYWLTNQRLNQALVIDWRSEQMNRNLMKALCSRQAKALPTLPTVTITGGAHTPQMEKWLKQELGAGVRATLEMPPQVTGEFEDLWAELTGGRKF
jgi:hypothetical protein